MHLARVLPLASPGVPPRALDGFLLRSGDVKTCPPKVVMTEFDVSKQNLSYYRNRRGGRWMGLAIAVGLSALLSYGIAKAVNQASNGTPLSSIQVTVLAALVLTVGSTIVVLAWGVLTMGPGAQIVQVSPQGIELRGPGARISRLNWGSPRLAFDLRDWSDQPAVASEGNPYYLAIPRGRTHALSGQAFSAALEGARQHGLAIRMYRGSGAWYGTSPMIYRVRGRLRIDGSESAAAPIHR
jgi:hypothetical protein